MLAGSDIITMSGFQRRLPAKEEVASAIQRLQQRSEHFVTIVSIGGTMGRFDVTESENTLDEPDASLDVIWLDQSFPDASFPRQDQLSRDFQRFWNSVAEHTEEMSICNVRLSTFAQTSPRFASKDRTLDEEVPPIWQVAAEIAKQVTDAEWANVPKDLARNVDHYLYGAPKKKEGA